MERPATGRLALAVALPLLLPAALGAQDSIGAAARSVCPSDTTAAARICQGGADALTAFLPVEGLLVGGGNPVPGTAAGLGRFGRLRLGARVGFAQVTIPRTDYDGTTDTVSADKRLLVPVPRLDLALGVFEKRLKLGTVTADLLGSAVVIPTGVTTRIRIDENARSLAGMALGLGYGIRLGMTMTAPRPAVSLSVMKRDMPGIRFGDRSAGARFSAATTLSVISGRLMVGGRVRPFTLAAGGGLDLYRGRGSVTFADSSGAHTTVAVDLSTSRILSVINLGLEAGPLKLWAEGGFQVGKRTELATHFERNDPSSGRFFGGLGAAIQF